VLEPFVSRKAIGMGVRILAWLCRSLPRQGPLSGREGTHSFLQGGFQSRVRRDRSRPGRASVCRALLEMVRVSKHPKRRSSACILPGVTCKVGHQAIVDVPSRPVYLLGQLPICLDDDREFASHASCW